MTATRVIVSSSGSSSHPCQCQSERCRGSHFLRLAFHPLRHRRHLQSCCTPDLPVPGGGGRQTQLTVPAPPLLLAGPGPAGNPCQVQLGKFMKQIAGRAPGYPTGQSGGGLASWTEKMPAPCELTSDKPEKPWPPESRGKFSIVLDLRKNFVSRNAPLQHDCGPRGRRFRFCSAKAEHSALSESSAPSETITIPNFELIIFTF